MWITLLIAGLIWFAAGAYYHPKPKAKRRSHVAPAMRLPRARFTVRRMMFAVALVSIISCLASKYYNNMTALDRAWTPEESRVVEIARRLVARNEGWADRVVYKVSREGNLWTVHAYHIAGYDWQGHPFFGLHDDCWVDIHARGEVIGYHRNGHH
jgi:hypothetical protein